MRAGADTDPLRQSVAVVLYPATSGCCCSPSSGLAAAKAILTIWNTAAAWWRTQQLVRLSVRANQSAICCKKIRHPKCLICKYGLILHLMRRRFCTILTLYPPADRERIQGALIAKAHSRSVRRASLMRSCVFILNGSRFW